MDNLEIAKALFGQKPQTASSGGQTSTAYGVAMSDSSSGVVMVNLGGDTVSTDDDQTIEVETTFAVFEGDEVIVQLVGADGTGKSPCVIGVVGRGDQMQNEIDSVTNYVWNDAAGLHVSTQERSVQGANILLDSDSLDIRNGNSNSEADQTVYASFGREVTVGSRKSGSTIGNYSQVLGVRCTASGLYSHADGFQCVAEGNYARAEGSVTNATGEHSHSEGYKTTASGQSSHAEGEQSEASGQGAHAEGLGTLAYGLLSHSEGSYTQATGDFSHAEGGSTYAQAAGAHSEGSLTQAMGMISHAEGYRTVASGDGSHTEGYYTQANSTYQHVQGKYNVYDSSDTYADIIGNGTADNARSNAYNMDWNGNAEFQGEVYVGGCTPNGETPYPVVRYNTSNSKQEYYDKANSTWAQVPGGGGGGWTELWTNSDPSSNFSAQTVPLDLSGYSVIAIACKQQNSTSIDMAIPCLGFVGNTLQCCVPNIGSTQYFYKRTATIASTGITFSTGYRNTTGTTGTNYCIPVAIYGVA